MVFNGIDWDLLGLEFHQQQFPFRGIGFVKLGWLDHGFFTDRSSFVE